MNFFNRILNLFKFKKENDSITTDEAMMVKPVDEIEETKVIKKTPKKNKTITKKPKKTEE